MCAKVIAFLIDAFSSLYLKKKLCPNIYDMAKHYFYSYIEPMFAFQGIGATIFTGAWPNTTNVWAEYVQQNEECTISRLSLQKVIRLADFVPDDKICWNVRSLTNRLLGKGYLGTPCVIPVKFLKHFKTKLTKSYSEKGCLADVKTIFDVLREENMTYAYFTPSTHDAKSIDATARMIRKNVIPDFTFLHLCSLDVMGHKFGPLSNMVQSMAAKIDMYIGKILKMADKLSDVHFMVFSDHGMSPVKSYVNTWKILSDVPAALGKDYLVFLDSTMIRFWFHNPEVSQVIVDNFSETAWGRILDEKDLSRFHIDKLGREHGEMIFAVSDSIALFPDFFRRHRPPKGMHGYAFPFYDKPVLIISQEAASTAARFIDILPTALKLLDLEPPKTCEGGSLID